MFWRLLIINNFCFLQVKIVDILILLKKLVAIYWCINPFGENSSGSLVVLFKSSGPPIWPPHDPILPNQKQTNKSLIQMLSIASFREKNNSNVLLYSFVFEIATNPTLGPEIRIWEALQNIMGRNNFFCHCHHFCLLVVTNALKKHVKARLDGFDGSLGGASICVCFCHCICLVFIGPRCPWSDLWV